MVVKVKTRWIIPVPNGSKVLVKTGDSISFGDKLIELRGYQEKIMDLSSFYNKIKEKDWDELKAKIIGLAIKEGELIFGEEAVFGKKPIATVSGKITKVDEFKNFYVQSSVEEKKSIFSPVDAKVAKIDEENLVLEFRAEEYPGVGVVEGRVWGSNGLKFAEHLTDLSIKDKGRIILVDELTPSILIKAEVVGVVGVVVIDSGVDESDNIISDLPILKVDGDKFFRLRKYAVDEDMRVLLNASSGRLLLCQK